MDNRLSPPCTGSLDVVADGVVVASKSVRITVPACQLHHVIDVLCGTQPRAKGEDGHGHGEDEHREDGRDAACTTVVPGRYATAVSIYNPGPCPATIEKRFAPLLINGKAVGREPRTVPAKPFARIVLQPGEASMDDCCALEEAVRIYPSTGTAAASGSVVHTRTVTPTRA